MCVCVNVFVFMSWEGADERYQGHARTAESRVQKAMKSFNCCMYKCIEIEISQLGVKLCAIAGVVAGVVASAMTVTVQRERNQEEGREGGKEGGR